MLKRRTLPLDLCRAALARLAVDWHLGCLTFLIQSSLSYIPRMGVGYFGRIIGIPGVVR